MVFHSPKYLPGMLIAGSLIFMSPLPAQEAEPAATPANLQGIWRAQMPAGDYLVNLSAITSLSQHEYLVEGAGKVSEVNIATQGSAIARFYFLEPALPQAPGGVGQSAVDLMKEKAGEAVGRAGGADLWTKVVKSYPVATHAHTIEYRVSNKETLSRLFKSAERAWTLGKGETFKP
ncbi:MAG: hypothetical protein WEB60_14175 [Terrimicrobiaceae bacterium]